MSITQILTELSGFDSTEELYNQYSDPQCLENMRLYLEYTTSLTTHLLLVAEAPGSIGCAITGIPFTSIPIIKDVEHNFLKT